MFCVFQLFHNKRLLLLSERRIQNDIFEFVVGPEVDGIIFSGCNSLFSSCNCYENKTVTIAATDKTWSKAKINGTLPITKVCTAIWQFVYFIKNYKLQHF